MPIEPRPLRTSIPLPPYLAVLAVDVEKFTQHSAYHQQVLSATIPSVLEDAFHRSGLEKVWRERRFPQSAGDSYVAGVEPQYLPFLVHPFLRHLQEALEDTQRSLVVHERGLRMRLRASIDVGPLPDSPSQQDQLDGIGRAMNDTHRLLDSPPVRDELRLSDLDITFVVAIVSGRVYEEAILGGFVGLNPRLFHPVDVELPAKQFRQEGYLYVPAPSRTLGDEQVGEGHHGAWEGDEPAAPASAGPDVATRAPTTAEAPPVNQMGDNYGQAVQGGTVRGGVHGDFGSKCDG